MKIGIMGIILLLGAVQAAAQPPVAGRIPGVDPKDVHHTLNEHGMFLWSEWDSGRFFTRLCMQYGGIDYRIEIAGPDERSVDSVWVEVRADSTCTDVLNCQQFFRVVAATPYVGSDPEQVEEWITDFYCNEETRNVVGVVEYVLRAPSKYQREMVMRGTD